MGFARIFRTRQTTVCAPFADGLMTNAANSADSSAPAQKVNNFIDCVHALYDATESWRVQH